MTDDVMRRLATARRLADAAGAAYRTGGPDRSMADPGAWQLARAADTIERAAGERRRWVSYLITVLIYPVLAWLTAELAGPVAGLPTGWAVAVAVVGFAMFSYPVLWLGRAVDRFLGRRRLAAALATTRPVTGDDAADLPVLLRRCRRELAAAIAGRVGPGGAAAFDGRRDLVQGLWYLSLADRSLCQAIMVLDPRRADR